MKGIVVEGDVSDKEVDTVSTSDYYYILYRICLFGFLSYISYELKRGVKELGGREKRGGVEKSEEEIHPLGTIPPFFFSNSIFFSSSWDHS